MKQWKASDSAVTFLEKKSAYISLKVSAFLKVKMRFKFFVSHRFRTVRIYVLKFQFWNKALSRKIKNVNGSFKLVAAT